MPPKIEKELVFFLTNVGHEGLSGDPEYFDKAKEAMKLITLKKIFLKPKDEIGILLCGDDSGEQCNKLIQANGPPSWDLVNKILEIQKCKKPFYDWPEAISEVIEYLQESKTQYKRNILILLLNCEDPCPGIDHFDLKSTSRCLKSLNVDFLWIGSKSLEDVPREKLNKSENILMQLLQQVNGKYMKIDEALPSLRFFKKPPTREVAWRCNLEIGSIAIPTKTYVKVVKEEQMPTFKKCKITDDNKAQMVKSDVDYVDKLRDVRDPSKIITGYMFGREFIPVPETDKSEMRNVDNKKAFEVFGFVPENAIKLEDLDEGPSRIVLPEDQDAQRPFDCLVQAMKDSKSVAIVRKVYRDKCGPKMAVLFPQNDVPGQTPSFIMVELLFQEDRRSVTSNLPNSIMKNLTEEQESVVGDFIDSMMLTDHKDEKGNELFAPGKVQSPCLQHVWNSFAHRALNPTDPLPPIADYLKKLVEPPEFPQSKALLSKIKELFPVEHKEELSSSEKIATVKTSEETVKSSPSLNEPDTQMEKPSVDLNDLFGGD